MYSLPPIAERLAVDMHDVQGLRAKARSGDPEALRAAAKQFEAMVVQTLLKNMRATHFAAPGDPMSDSGGAGLYRELLDQQWAQRMTAGRGLGFAEAMFKAMQSRERSVAAETMASLEPGASSPTPAVAESDSLRPAPRPTDATRATAGGPRTGDAGSALAAPAAAEAGDRPLASAPAPLPAPPSTVAVNAAGAAPVRSADAASRFLERLRPHAEKVAGEIGVPAEFILAHAALESGWGQRPIRTASGDDSHNLFGIKAGRGWKGGTVDQLTTEFRYGAALTKVEAFRAYESFDAAFRDYAALLKSRYPEAIQAGATVDRFAAALAEGGYATDPAYAEKLKQVAAGVSRRSVQV